MNDALKAFPDAIGFVIYLKDGDNDYDWDGKEFNLNPKHETFERRYFVPDQYLIELDRATKHKDANNRPGKFQVKAKLPEAPQNTANGLFK